MAEGVDRKLTDEEIEQVRNETNFEGNVVFSAKIGASRVVFIDKSIAKTPVERQKVVRGIERAIENIYPGYDCTITVPAKL